MFSIEEIESIMDDTREAMEKQREIDALLSGQLTSDEEHDVLRELDQLVAAAEEEGELRLPDAPNEELPGNQYFVVKK
jgi:charged multivesicular body protein 6